VLALALVTQKLLCVELLNYLSVQLKDIPDELTDSSPLLDHLKDILAPASSQTSTESSTVHTTPTVGIQPLADRLLDRVADPAGVEEPLTSHSYRRGGAQHINACSELTVEWIIDRCAWNLTTTNKAFAYVFNTPKEDHQVAKVLSGMAPKQSSVLQLLEVFDSRTQEQTQEVRDKLFNASHALGNIVFNAYAAIRDIQTATTTLHYPSLVKTDTQWPVMTMIKCCAEVSSVTMSNLIAWSQQLTSSATYNRTDYHESPDRRKREIQSCL
jgi:hypothetical protein